MTSKSKVYFFSEKVRPNITKRGSLKKYIESIFKKEGGKLGSLIYVFCNDSHLRRINRDFLKHDYYTDIVTFNLAEIHSPIFGEVYISVERVKDNAEKMGVSFKSEIHRVIFHGALHLCGYSDKRKEEKIKMRKKEDFYLAKYFLQRRFT